MRLLLRLHFTIESTIRFLTPLFALNCCKCTEFCYCYKWYYSGSLFQRSKSFSGMLLRQDYSSDMKIENISHNMSHSSAPLLKLNFKKSPAQISKSPLCVTCSLWSGLCWHNVVAGLRSLCLPSLCETWLVGKPVEIGYRPRSACEQLLKHNTYRKMCFLGTLLKTLLC